MAPAFLLPALRANPIHSKLQAQGEWRRRTVSSWVYSERGQTFGPLEAILYSRTDSCPKTSLLLTLLPKNVLFFHFEFVFFLIGGNCFIILCWLLPYITMTQPQACMRFLPLEPPSTSRLPPFQLSRLSHSAGDELPAPYRKCPLASYFTCGNVYVSMPLSPFVSPSFSSTVSTSLFSMSASPLLPCRLVHQYHLSRFQEWFLR